ncbi:MAG: peroxide stress protein YaaA [Lacrimispora sp.]|uniref:peroxide stress protein YaaA n=1 Tax=Lacrimispora sp. TaxID=2719234 RepID=UPI0039E24661
MRIIISPAKKMNTDTDILEADSLPQFLPEAEIIKKRLQEMDREALQNLWGCNDSIASQNVKRLKKMDLHNGLTPALLAYEGIQYQYMAPGVFEDGHFDFISQHLRILSGFYGLLRPFDGVTPYRLEMQARLSIDGSKDLYGYWGDKPARQLLKETDFILNLASKEYSKAITPYLPKTTRFLTCTFGELKEGKVVEKGTLCKMARGQMVRFMAEHGITVPEEIKSFDQLGYGFSKEHSTENNFVFIKSKTSIH